MPNNSGTLEILGSSLGRLLAPLEERLSQGQVLILFAELGMQFPPELETKASFMDALQKTSQSARQLPGALFSLLGAIKSEDTGAIISSGLELFNLIKVIVLSTDEIATQLKNVAGTLPGVNLADVTTFANELPTHLIDYLVIRNLETVPGLAEILDFVGGIERQEVNVNGLQFIRRKLQLNEFSKFLQSPGERLKVLYKWGAPDFNGVTILQKLEKFLVQNGFPAILDNSLPNPVLDAFFGEISANTDIDPKGLLIRITEPISVNNAVPFSQDNWKIEFIFNGQLIPNLQIIVQPNGKVTFQPPAGQLQGEAAVKWTGGKPDSEPYIILGEIKSSRVEAKQLLARGGISLVWNNTTGQAEGDFKVSGEVKGGKIVIDFSQGDGFISQILSAIRLESDFDLGLGFSSREGIFFIGSATLELQLPTHINLGFAEINALTFRIGIQGLKFPIIVSANIKANLGPLTATIEQIGIKADLSLPPDRKGNAGPVNFVLGFNPPKGVGLSIDAGVVKGGGYLYFDFEKEEYAGALELVFSGFLNLKAIGLITTRMPDGSKGFSLLIIITAEFGTGIQLGFGFTLIGVGGLIGLNRTMRLQPLMEGVRTGAINSIMFPRDVIANAPRIISDLRTIFPPENGKFLIGPMAKLGWGTPTLVSLAIGVIIEIPGNIAIIGVLRLALPDPDAALIIIQVNFAGAIEFDKKRVYFFAALFESRILFMTIEGEMGLLMAFGDDANFVLSVGGFHPSFNPPPLPFPAPRRISVNILSSPTARIQVTGYFAVTSNTVQFGAHAELVFGFDDFGIQGHIAFDALLQFSPFHFIIEISASVSLRAFGVGLFSIHLRFSLEGPTPWRARGSGSLSILFFEISADFDITWGEARNTTLPPIAAMPLLKAEFDKVENWHAFLPASSNLLVTLRKVDPDPTTLVLHPVGSLRISQKAIPLDLAIDKVGAQQVSDAKRFTVRVTGGFAKRGDTSESFALAQFQNFDDATKLSRPAFEIQHGGVDLSVQGAQLASAKVVKRVVRYEEIIIDTNFKRFVRRFFRIDLGVLFYQNGLFSHFLSGASVSKSALSQHVKGQMQPFAEKIAVQSEGYVVAFNHNNSAFSGQATNFSSATSAHDFMQQQIAADPNLAETLHVIPAYEVSG